MNTRHQPGGSLAVGGASPESWGCAPSISDTASSAPPKPTHPCRCTHRVCTSKRAPQSLLVIHRGHRTDPAPHPLSSGARPRPVLLPQNRISCCGSSGKPRDVLDRLSRPTTLTLQKELRQCEAQPHDTTHGRLTRDNGDHVNGNLQGFLLVIIPCALPIPFATATTILCDVGNSPPRTSCQNN